MPPAQPTLDPYGGCRDINVEGSDHSRLEATDHRWFDSPCG